MPDWIPLNWRIMSEPLNWVIMLLMVVIAGFAFEIITDFISEKQES